VVGATAFGTSSLYWSRDHLPLPSAWVLVGAWFILVGALVALCARWSRSRGWGAAHRLALAGGALLTYVWVGFTHVRDMGVPYATGLWGGAVFGLGATILLAAAVRALPVAGRTGGTARETAPLSAEPADT
jgi:hypothetical protein